MTLPSRLLEYITSGTFPKDAELYLTDSKLGGYCVFCEVEHDGIPFGVPQNINDDEPDEMFHICQDCDIELKDNLIGQTTLYPPKYSANKLHNLHTYINDKELPEDKYMHLAGGSKDLFCLFCKEQIIGVGWPLEIACGQVLEYYGGFVQICDGCHDFLVNHNVLSLHHLVDSAVEETCPSCEEFYYVTYDEHRLRTSFKTVNHHFCPECFKKKRQVEFGKPLSINMECEVCQSDVRCDLTLSVNNPLDTHLPNVYCDICSLASQDPEHEIIIKHDIEYIYLYVNAQKQCYTIFRHIPRKRKMQQLVSINLRNLQFASSEIAWMASKKVYELIKQEQIVLPPIQKKLIL